MADEGWEASVNAHGRWENINDITYRVIGCAHKVSNALGCGFLEKVYENALAHELRKAGLRVTQQQAIKVWYDGVIVGDYVADLLVEDVVLVELKAVQTITPLHEAQGINYLKATGLTVCLILNFGAPEVAVRRLVHNFRA